LNKWVLIFLVVLIIGCIAPKPPPIKQEEQSKEPITTLLQQPKPPPIKQEEPEEFKIAREFNYEEVFRGRGTPEEEENYILRSVLAGFPGGGTPQRVGYPYVPYPGYYPHIDPKKTEVEMEYYEVWSPEKNTFVRVTETNLSDPQWGVLSGFKGYNYYVIAIKKDSKYELYPAIYGSPTGEKVIKDPQPLTLMRFANPKDSKVLYTSFTNVIVVEMKKVFRKGIGSFETKQHVIIDDKSQQVMAIVVQHSAYTVPTDYVLPR
jgi:hypothetical protein